jgi:hypothetical protein
LGRYLTIGKQRRHACRESDLHLGPVRSHDFIARAGIDSDLDPCPTGAPAARVSRNDAPAESSHIPLSAVLPPRPGIPHE